MSSCTNCPLSCGADRKNGVGACGVDGIKIAKYYLHPFEEPSISYKNGSGCIFFCGCSLKCVFCQNYPLSRVQCGKDITVEELAAIFKELEDMGADNINLVNPTHYIEHIIGAMKLYRPSIPIVYNSHGYEKIESLKRIDEYIDIYLPDLKFLDNALSKRYTRVGDYADYAREAVAFMAKKPLRMENSKMLSGCIIRHLILPLAVYDSIEVIKFVSTLSGEPYFSLMSQYTPYGELSACPELKRKITKREYLRALEEVKNSNLTRVYLQDLDSSGQSFIPKWDF